MPVSERDLQRCLRVSWRSRFRLKTAGQVSLSAGTPVASGTIQVLAQTGIQTLRSTSSQVARVMTLFTLTRSAPSQGLCRGGEGDDVLGTYNSGANTAGDIAQFTGGEIKGGSGNDTVFVTLSATSATDFKIVGNAGIDSVAYSGASHETNSGFIGGGENDSVHFNVVTATYTTINGGDGDDTESFHQYRHQQQHY